jgi:hypothetical protein
MLPVCWTTISSSLPLSPGFPRLPDQHVPFERYSMVKGQNDLRHFLPMSSLKSYLLSVATKLLVAVFSSCV